MDYNIPTTNILSISTYFTNKLLMKQKLFGAAAMVAFILFAASCNEQKQSEFNFDSVTQEVTVSAKVTYDAGVKINPNNPKSYIIANAEPAKFKKVFIEIPYSEYKAGATGSKIFEALTDSTGLFTISLPTKSTGVKATIRLEEFTAVHQEYDKMGDDGKPVFKIKIYTYSTPVLVGGTPGIVPGAPGYVAPREYMLMPGAFTFPDNNDLTYDGAPVDEEAYDESVTIAGTINLAYETGFHQGAFKEGNNAIIEFLIKYAEFNDPLTFGTTTDENGNYSVSLPMKSLATGFAIRSIKVLGVGQNEFVHWTDSVNSMIVAGAYMTNQNTIYEAPAAGPDLPFGGVVGTLSYNLGVKKLPFVPYYNGGIIENTPQPEGWDPNLAGWAAAKFDESYNKVVTVKGRILMPKLTAYGIGKYGTSKQEIRLRGGIYQNYEDPVNLINPQGYTIITDKEGNFSIDLPVQNETVDPGIIIEPKEPNMPFTFINSKGEKITLNEGTYATKAIISDPDAEWYELGNIYFGYTPDPTVNGEKPDEWNDNLIGWYVNPNFNEKVTVKGKMLFAYESSYGIGGYQSLNKLVTVEDYTNAPSRYFAIMPAADGTFDFDLPVNDKTTARRLRVIFVDPNTAANLFPTYEFKHYTKYGASVAPMLLQGHYTQKHKVFETAQDNVWNNLGTYYMYLNRVNVNDIANIPTYRDNLAGWFVSSDNNVKRTDHATVSGYAKFAEETGYMEGAMNPGANKLIPVSIDGTTLYVLTNNTGKFEVEAYLKEEGGHPTLALPLPAIPIPAENFMHYTNAEGQTELLAGNYNGERITPKEAQWNDFGTIYYKFTPDAPPANWNFTEDIAGWKYQQDYEFTKTVTGYVKLAKETGYLKGNYQTEKDIPVKIYWDKNGNGIHNANNEPAYIGKTDENGKFTITIPVEKETDEPTIEVDGLAFDYEPGFLHYADAKGKTQVLAGAYNGEQVKVDDAAWNDLGTIYYKFTPDVPPTNWNNFVQYTSGWFYKKDYIINKTVTGDVKLAKETSYLKGNYQTEANIPVKIHLDYDKDGVVDLGEPYLVAPTDANGKFSIIVPVKQANDEPDIIVQGLGYGGGAGIGFDYKEFLHYKDIAGKTEIVEGKYKGQQIKGDTDEWNNTGSNYSAGVLYYTFYPTNNPDNWNYAKYIADWVKKDGYNVTKTVTGYVKLAKETAYLKGNYQAGQNLPVMIRLAGDLTRTYVAPTDANGKFTINVSLQDESQEPAVSFPDIDAGNELDLNEKFDHYTDATTIKKLVGTYTGQQVKEPDAKWNEPGTLYYKFTPDNTIPNNKPANWDTQITYLAGWFYKQNFTVSKTVTGQIKMARETGYLKGDFGKSAKDLLVMIRLNGFADRTFVAPADANGKFSIPILVENEEDRPNVTFPIIAADLECKDFLYYESATKTKTLAGNYNGEQIKKDAEVEWNNEGTIYDAGTIYYKFTPDELPAEWNTYTQHLAGWFYKKDYETTKTVTGSIKLAKETGYLLGEYAVEKDVPVKINLATIGDFVAPTDANGIFSIPVLVKDDTQEPNVTVDALGEGNPDNPADTKGFFYDKFSHIDAKGQTKTLSGKYFGTQIKDAEAAWNEAGIIYYKFYPKTTIKPTEWDNFTKYTAGWFFKDGFNITKTVSGVIKKARETGYLTGDFGANPEGTPVKIQVAGAADRIYVLPASENGSFELNIHVKSINDEPAVAYVLTPIPDDEFIHYKNVDKKTEKIAGSFALGTPAPIKENGTEWGKLGTVYYKFTPDAPTAFWTTYTRYIAGWFIKDGYKVAKTVTGKVKLAREKSFRNGDYEAEAEGVPVKFRLYGSDDHMYVGATNDEGSFSITVYIRHTDEDPGAVDWKSIDLSLEELNNREFLHYYKAGAVETQPKVSIAGNFHESGTAKDPAKPWNQLGTRFYKFVKDGVVENWTESLSGWAFWDYNETKALTFKGAIKKAVETKSGSNDAKGVWVAVPYATANVTVDGHAYKVATDAQGKFSVTVKKVDGDYATLPVTITPDNIEVELQDPFYHYPDKTKNQTVPLTGHYASAGNVAPLDIDRDGSTNNYDLTKMVPHSAKMTFVYDGLKPTGWDDIKDDWDTDLD